MSIETPQWPKRKWKREKRGQRSAPVCLYCAPTILPAKNTQKMDRAGTGPAPDKVWVRNIQLKLPWGGLTESKQKPKRKPPSWAPRCRKAQPYYVRVQSRTWDCCLFLPSFESGFHVCPFTSPTRRNSFQDDDQHVKLKTAKRRKTCSDPRYPFPV